MDYNDYIANTHVQEIAKEYNIQNEMLKKIWSLADETIKQYNKIFKDIESITDGGYQNHKPCAGYLFIKCATY
jgi:predicted transcriptional regulator